MKGVSLSVDLKERMPNRKLLMAEIREQLGNSDLLRLPRTAFLCSRKVPAGVILKCYDWAIEQREKGSCVISGFHSTIEKDVFHYLLKGRQPIIMALHRGIGPEMESNSPMRSRRVGF